MGDDHWVVGGARPGRRSREDGCPFGYPLLREQETGKGGTITVFIQAQPNTVVRLPPVV